jgi:hypothetical protein
MKKIVILLAVLPALLGTACGGLFGSRELEGNGWDEPGETAPGSGLLPSAIVIRPAIFVSPGETWGDVLDSLNRYRGVSIIIKLDDLLEDLNLMLESCGYNDQTGKFDSPPTGNGTIKGVPFYGVNSFVYLSGGVKQVDRYWGDDWGGIDFSDESAASAFWDSRVSVRQQKYDEFRGTALPASPPSDLTQPLFASYRFSIQGVKLILASFETTYAEGWASGGCNALAPRIEAALAALDGVARQFYLGLWPSVTVRAVSFPTGAELAALDAAPLP